MARDPLAVLWRLRETAVAEAGRELAQAREGVRRAALQLEVQREHMRREQADTGYEYVAAFAAWLPQAQLQAQRRQAALLDAQAHAQRLQQVLASRRTESEAVAKALQRRRAAVALNLARREQAAMDEAAGRRNRQN